MLSLDLSGKLALITGATGQLGRVMVDTLSDCGADIVIHYNKNEIVANELLELVKSKGKNAITVQADVTDYNSIISMRDKVVGEIGKPDIIVNNAVIQYEWKSVLEQDIKDYHSQYDSCVMHNVYMAKAFIPYMIEKNYGRVIAINTECAAMAEAGCSAYTAGKRGLDGIVRCLAKEVGMHNITVNQVAPGWTISFVDRDNKTEIQDAYSASVPLKRRGTDQEIANMVAFLASDLASFTTGAYIPVSGGRVMPSI